MLTVTYKGRKIEIAEEVRNDNDLTGLRKPYLAVTVNGARQFSFPRRDGEELALAHTCHYIDAADLDDERRIQKGVAVLSQTRWRTDNDGNRVLALVGGYMPAASTDFADSWRASA